RSRGQAPDRVVARRGPPSPAAHRPTIAGLLEEAYRRLYSRSIPGVEIEILSWVVTLSGPAEGRLADAQAEQPREPKPRGWRAVFDPDSGEFADVPIFWRPDLAPGVRIAGPAVIAEDETSTVVSPRFDARIDRFGYIELLRREDGAMVARPNAALAQIHTQIMWSRLIAVVEEQAQTMLRTAFSTSVREAGDLSAGVFDRHGRMLAQAVTGTPGHVNSMANAVVHFLKEFPLREMKPGDHYITND